MEEKKNIRLILEYDGSLYHGWQRQKGVSTIQGVMEDRIRMMIKDPVKLIASGRTDAGVHALNQACHFITRSKIDPESLRRGLNSLLPDDIVIKKAEYAPLDFHSRYDAKSKTYEYRILNQEQPNIFLRNYTWHIRGKLELMEMERCLSFLEGKHDFSSFRSSGSGNMNPVREMMRAEIHGPEEGIIRLVFEADGFLRHMVRNIVGTVAGAGLGRINADRFREILESKDRRAAGIKAPAQGLFLVSVSY